MRKFTLLLMAGLLVSSVAFGWGREGHETIARIADNNLKPSARKVIERYLGDRSIVYYAKWMDEYRHTPEYGFTTHWHVGRVDEALNYSPNRETGDAISAINQAVGILEDYRNQTDSTVAVNIKYLLHLVGDMHCPAHIYYIGRNQDYRVRFGGGYIKPVKEMNIHTVWDEAVIQSSRIWSVSEWAEELDRMSPKEIRKVVDGTPQDWLEDNARRCLVQFGMSSPGSKVAQDFVNESLPLIEVQILYAGYRLAAVLNRLF